MVGWDACEHLNWGQRVDGGRDGLMRLGRGGGVASITLPALLARMAAE
jgi:hypothetical protein